MKLSNTTNHIDFHDSSELKIVLVYPSKHHSVRSLFTFHKNEGIGLKPPLGIMILATYLRLNGFRSVYCLDAQLNDLSPEQSINQLLKFQPDVVGFTTWTDFWYPIWKTVKLLKEKRPTCKIVLGGPHCTVYPGECLEYSAADFVVAGDGEETLLNLVEDLYHGKLVNDYPGLWRKENKKILPPLNPLSIVKDLTKIPAPDRLLLPYKRYNSILNPDAFETTMVTSRGCPYKCNFCKMHVQQVYARNVEQVVEEFSMIAELGISDIQVYDDTFTWSKKRVIDICQGILDSGIKIRWAIRDRVSRADPEIYALMKKAGCYRIHFGVESGSPLILEVSGKEITLEQAQYAVEIAKQTGFETLSYYMFGLLNETYQDALKTIDFAIKLNTDYAVFAVAIPYPGTRLYEIGLERGILKNDFWKEFTEHPIPDFEVPNLIEQYIDRNTLIRLKDMALLKYYFRPKMILQEISKLRTLKEFKQKLFMAFNITSDSLMPIIKKVLS